ncbi:DNA polymerase III subunit delta [Thiolapillus brandeum]|uniref:DNA polymerase III subunit delta n=1 Tax=Thiolapillus brandeum TaxID=1076588 RepID=A0A7U6JJN7_9GAMM|nr:DNA polymerase III subunit delta [Thiolapillus brandeum]BAO45638.1 DNA polymerase III delta subunit [Thiolapillus brandeum]
MKLRLEQLASSLNKGLAPVYVISGDEPLQLGEAADQVRAAARQAGYLSREIMEADARFDWNRLGEEANALSLFAEQKIIDLRLPSGKPGTTGARALVEYCGNPPADTLLLVTLPRVPLTAKWIKALEKTGVLVQVWPIDEGRLPRWIAGRMQAAGLRPERGVAEMLAEHTEGNLLAARQEIEKLVLLYGEGAISQEQLLDAVSDSARFDVYALVDAALAGRKARCTHILSGLKGEGIAPPVVLWALAREIRGLANMAAAMATGMSVSQAMNQARVWKARAPLVSQGLRRLKPEDCSALLEQCMEIDAAIKGGWPGDPWLMLEQVTLALAVGPCHLTWAGWASARKTAANTSM